MIEWQQELEADQLLCDQRQENRLTQPRRKLLRHRKVHGETACPSKTEVMVRRANAKVMLARFVMHSKSMAVVEEFRKQKRQLVHTKSIMAIAAVAPTLVVNELMMRGGWFSSFFSVLFDVFF